MITEGNYGLRHLYNSSQKDDFCICGEAKDSSIHFEKEPYIPVKEAEEARRKYIVPLTNPAPDTNLQEMFPKEKYEEMGVQKMDGQILKSGEKKDEGKARFELLPYEVIAAVARILTAGAKKYADRNWERGISYGRVFGAAQRHLTNFWNSHLNDTDGINHADGSEMDIDHAICELMFLSAYEKRGLKSFDDRPTK